MGHTVEDPPPVKSSTNDWYGLAALATLNPGKWVKAETPRSPSFAGSIKRGRLKAFRPVGYFDACVRLVDGNPNLADLYVKYVGDPTDG